MAVSGVATRRAADLRLTTPFDTPCPTPLPSLHLDDVGNGLRVGGGARAAAEDAVGDGRELVGDAVGDVHASCGARVCADHHAAVVLHCHDGRARAVLLAHPRGRVGDGQGQGHAWRWIPGEEELKTILLESLEP
jgi:hypothetical protein